ncbi:MAG: V-type ATP synthase subunit A [Conexivisphaerales archaeon]
MPIKGKISEIRGTVVKASGMAKALMNEMVKVGELGLIGEVVRLEGDSAYIQVYEFTTALRPGEPVVGLGSPLSVMLGPGMMGNIYDGLQRPLSFIKGHTITRGYSADPIDAGKRWKFIPSVKKGDQVSGGAKVGFVDETDLIRHYIMIPPGISGQVAEVEPEGEYTVNDNIIEINDGDKKRNISMVQKWPVRVPRPFSDRVPSSDPLITGQRVIDSFFPIAKGGSVAVPGGFGTGKCLLPEEHVFTDLGAVSLAELWAMGNEEISSNGGNARRLSVGVISLKNGALGHSESAAVFRDRSRSMIRISTANGREVVVTPAHRLWMITKNGMEETPAFLLKPGDRLVEPSAKWMLGGLEADRIKEVKVEYGKFDVYDLVVPKGQSFVGGSVRPVIYHNTVLLHQIASWANSKVVVYVGCGERGNEMVDLLKTFPRLNDPISGKPIMEKSVMVANVSNMPVAAREASIYVGITMAEYFRDQGYDALLLADSTSRWAEALREISGRLEEIPAEEGYPAYLASRIASFYERAGVFRTLGGDVGSVSVVGAVSPPGGDFTEPVTTHTLRYVKAFWLLDPNLAYSRHYPAVNWVSSYSAYSEQLERWWAGNIASDFSEIKRKALDILYREDELRNIVRLLGPEVLPEEEKLVLETASIIKDGFLKQSAYHEVDRYTAPKSQYQLLKLIITFYQKGREKIQGGSTVEQLKSGEAYMQILRARYNLTSDKLYEELMKKVTSM